MLYIITRLRFILRFILNSIYVDRNCVQGILYKNFFYNVKIYKFSVVPNLKGMYSDKISPPLPQCHNFRMWKTLPFYLPGSKCEALRLGVHLILILYQDLILDPEDFCFIRLHKWFLTSRSQRLFLKSNFRFDYFQVRVIFAQISIVKLKAISI